MRRPRSLRARVALAGVLALALSLLLAGALLVSTVSREARAAVDAELEARAERVERAVRERGRGGPGRGDRGPAPRGAGDEAGDPRSSAGDDRDGAAARDRARSRREDAATAPPTERPAGRTGGAGTAPPPGPRFGALPAIAGEPARILAGDEVVLRTGDARLAALPAPTSDGFSTVEAEGEPWRSLVVTPPGESGLRVQLLQSLAPVERAVAGAARLVVVFGLLALALTAAAAWAATSWVLRPLGRLGAAAAEVSGTGDLARRLPRTPEDPDEIRALTASLNDMLARLEASAAATDQALRATRRFAADAGHELRTPMTALRANLDALTRNPGLGPAERDRALEEMRVEQNRMVALLSGLQALARGEAAGAVPRERVELADVVDAGLEAARRRHPLVHFELDPSSSEPAVEGWPDGLRMLVDNLLDNAAVHGRPDGRVLVRLAPDAPDGVEVVVEDDGPGLPAEERERVLEPFARGTKASAPGSGLGLAVVAQQAAIHGGEVRLAEAERGGLRAAVRLPLGAA